MRSETREDDSSVRVSSLKQYATKSGAFSAILVNELHDMRANTGSVSDAWVLDRGQDEAINQPKDDIPPVLLHQCARCVVVVLQA